MPCSICKKAGHNKSSCKVEKEKMEKEKMEKMEKKVEENNVLCEEEKKEPDEKTVEEMEKVKENIVLCEEEKKEPDEKKDEFKVQSSTLDMDIERFCAFITTVNNTDIVLLRHKEVIQWLFGDLSFLGEIERVNKSKDDEKYKVLEDKWGQTVLKIRRPDLKLDKQWTNKFGEHLCEEMCMLLGKKVSKPKKMKNYQPDSEVDDAIVEAKAQTFYTSGTAGEKILGCPFKYAEIPELYGKPLKIVCMGGAEKVCRENYGNLPGDKCTEQKQKFLDFYKSMGIEYVGASDILRKVSV